MITFLFFVFAPLVAFLLLCAFAQPNEIRQRNVIDYGAEVPPGIRVVTTFVDVQSDKEGEGGQFELAT